MSTRWQRIAREQAGDDYAARYAERFRTMAERGDDVHGEAGFVTDLRPPPATVLDAGCGTGRIAVRLAELGYAVVGLDLDASMLEMARAEAPALDWRLGDLADFDLGATYDLVLVAGNTIPLLDAGTLRDACRCLAAHLAPGGVLVSGHGLDAAHLPGDCPPTDLDDVDAAFAEHGLQVAARHGTWEGGAFDPADGYAVSVYTRAAAR